MAQITVKDAENDIKTFVDFPYELYKNDPYWVGELKADTRKLLRPDNAFWQHTRRRLLLAYKDGRAAGRLCVLVNDVYNEYHQENIGFFGFFTGDRVFDGFYHGVKYHHHKPVYHKAACRQNKDRHRQSRVYQRLYFKSENGARSQKLSDKSQ